MLQITLWDNDDFLSVFRSFTTFSLNNNYHGVGDLDITSDLWHRTSFIDDEGNNTNISLAYKYSDIENGRSDIGSQQMCITVK